METTSVIITLLGGITLLLGLVSRRLETSSFSLTLAALAIGIVLGPAVTGIIDLSALGKRPIILKGVAHLTLAIGLTGVALGIPKPYVRREWRHMLLLLLLAMPLMWVISTVLIMLVLRMAFWLAALIGAMLAPTDPVASGVIVGGALGRRNLPDEMRHAISFESGANDGLAYPFVLLPFMMLTYPPGVAWVHWLVQTLLLDVLLAIALGLLLGYAAARLLLLAAAHGFLAEKWHKVYAVALALLAAGVGWLVRSDGLLLVFSASATFVQVVSDKEAADAKRTQDAIDCFFSVPIFAVLGMTIPWEGWQALGWHGVLLAAAVLLRRRPPVLLLLRPLLKTVRRTGDALYIWVGSGRSR